MPKVTRFDAGKLQLKKDAWETPEGFLEGFALGTKVGVFPYADEKGNLQYEYRPAEELFKADSLASMKRIVITLDHPMEGLVNVSNAARLAKGFTGTDVYPDGDRIYTDLKITHQDAVQAVKDGKDQVSYGYTVNLVQQKGEYKGIPYDAIQTDIHYNHLALVDQARMGPDARVMMDAADTRTGQPVMRLDGSGNQVFHPGITEVSPIKDEVKIMPKFKIDNLEYEASPEVINFIGKLQTAHDELKGKADSLPGLNTQIQTLTGERDGLKSKLDEELKKDRSAEVAEAVKARVALLDSARAVLPADTKLDELSNLDIQKAVILARADEAKRPELKITLDKAEAVYIQARFDATVETLPPVDALAAQRKTATDAATTSTSGDLVADAQAKHDKAELNRWKEKK